MLVRDWMTKDVVSVDDDTPIMKAGALMREKRIRFLPVVNKHGSLTGVLTDRDLKAASPSCATSLDVYELNYLLSNVKAGEIMTRDPVIVKQDETIEFAAALLLDNKISGLPVVDAGLKLVGVITQSDVFKTLVKITGTLVGGVQFAFHLDDRPGSLKEVADEIRRLGGRIVSVLTHYPESGDKFREVYLRIMHVPADQLENMKKELGAKFRILYVVEDFAEEVKRRKKR
ncbi:MAG: CBS domain-containing protein [Nitrospinae bacterium]|nr:CBS domain-containing protein [Nitrospinota bacterium]MBF0633179.1 CBS domain-containing protein [Nitrospinota bacterium]